MSCAGVLRAGLLAGIYQVQAGGVLVSAQRSVHLPILPCADVVAFVSRRIKNTAWGNRSAMLMQPAGALHMPTPWASGEAEAIEGEVLSEPQPAPLATSEDYFLISEAIRAMWSSLSPPSRLGTSGLITPIQFLRLMWQLDAVCHEAAETATEISPSASPNHTSSTECSAPLSGSLQHSWKRFLRSLTEEFGNDNHLAASISHKQFESFFWAFSDSIQEPAARSRVFQLWANTVAKPKSNEIEDILSLMDGNVWKMSPRIGNILGISESKASTLSDLETSLLVVKHLIKQHGNAPWHWWYRIRPTLIKLVPALGSSNCLTSNSNMNVFPSMSKTLEGISLTMPTAGPGSENQRWHGLLVLSSWSVSRNSHNTRGPWIETDRDSKIFTCAKKYHHATM